MLIHSYMKQLGLELSNPLKIVALIAKCFTMIIAGF